MPGRRHPLPKIQPLEDRVVIAPDDPEKVTASGLIIPDNAQEKPQRGTVIAVGPGKYEGGTFVAQVLQPGDAVLYSRYGTTEIQLDGQTYIILDARDLLATLN